MKAIFHLFLFGLLLTCAPASAQSADTGQLSTHILDLQQGKPAPGVTVRLYRVDTTADTATQIWSGKTDSNGRIAGLLASGRDNRGTYRLRFETAAYFEEQRAASLYPYVEVTFRIDGDGHYHIPITLSANGYSTYRGN